MINDDIAEYESRGRKLIARHCLKRNKNKDNLSCYEGFTHWYKIKLTGKDEK